MEGPAPSKTRRRCRCCSSPEPQSTIHRGRPHTAGPVDEAFDETRGSCLGHWYGRGRSALHSPRRAWSTISRARAIAVTCSTQHLAEHAAGKRSTGSCRPAGYSSGIADTCHTDALVDPVVSTNGRHCRASRPEYPRPDIGNVSQCSHPAQLHLLCYRP